MIELSDIVLAYPGAKPVLDGVSLTIPVGSHTALTGGNGAGKSTLALILKGLLAPLSGRVSIDGVAASDDAGRRELMRRVGLVFQNPEDTIVATTVERELAFGLENAGIPRDEMVRRVDVALRDFDLERYRHGNPSRLSGGEKQRLALAAVMVMRPSALILDEPTSLLDPWSRGHILDIIDSAAAGGAAVLHITQYPREAARADRVIHLDRSGITDVSPGNSSYHRDARQPQMSGHPKPADGAEPALVLDGIGHVYERGTPFEHAALAGVSLVLRRGTTTAVLGPTGSGKTTLLEIAAGVTKPTQGRVSAGKKTVRAMAFQFPEDQMFGDTVAEYAAFGPRNMGVPEDELARTVDAALTEVGLDPEAYRTRDPLTLSGGEKRRAALAGVLAMRPDVLVLDEPFAALDRMGTSLVYGFLDRYVREGGTLLFSTHDFDVARRLSDYAVVMNGGRIETSGPTKEVFASSPLIGEALRG